MCPVVKPLKARTVCVSIDLYCVPAAVQREAVGSERQRWRAQRRMRGYVQKALSHAGRIRIPFFLVSDLNNQKYWLSVKIKP